MSNDGFVEVGGGEFWGSKDEPLKAGDSITGDYTGTQKDVGLNNSQVHNLKTAEGTRSIWGSTVLDSRFAQVNLGDTVRVTFTGLSDKPGKFGKPFKTYKVEVKPGVVGQDALATDPAGEADDLDY